MNAPLVLSLGDRVPEVDPEAWIAPGATVVGAVRLGAAANVWYGAVLRADGSTIEVGARSNIQDGCVVHADQRRPVVVGRDVSVGHRAVLHGCTVEDGALVGMGAVVLTGARIGRESLVAAGSVVREAMVVPPRSLVAGVPAVVRRSLTDNELEGLRANARAYLELTETHRDAEHHDASREGADGNL